MTAIFPAVFLCAKNVHETKLINLFIASVLAFFLSSLFYYSSFLINKDFHKAALCAFLAIMIFYKSGHYYKKLVNKKLREIIFIRILYSFLTLFFIYQIFLLSLKISFNLELLSNIIFYFYAFVILIPIAKIIGFYAKNKDQKVKIDKRSAVDVLDKNLPDVYYIVVDGYAGINTLKDICGFDNSEFYSHLKKEGFCVSDKTKSNYTITNLSVCSTLNMNYIQDFFDSSTISSDQGGIHKLYKFHLDNEVSRMFKSYGYTYVHLINHWEQMYFNEDEFADISIKSSQSTDYLKIFLQKTLIGIYQDILFSAVSRKNMKFLFEKLKNIHSIKGPKFVFSHLICPHEPYLFNENGDKPKMKNEDPANKENIPLYVEQIKYVNKILTETISNILKNSKNSIIVIKADHGSEFLMNVESSKSKDGAVIWPKDPSPEMLQERFEIFNAIYLPDNDVEVFDKFQSSVNIFRFIFNKYFSTNYEILPERQYYSNYVDHFIFRDVTDKLN